MNNFYKYQRMQNFYSLFPWILSKQSWFMVINTLFPKRWRDYQGNKKKYWIFTKVKTKKKRIIYCCNTCFQLRPPSLLINTCASLETFSPIYPWAIINPGASVSDTISGIPNIRLLYLMCKCRWQFYKKKIKINNIFTGQNPTIFIEIKHFVIQFITFSCRIHQMLPWYCNIILFGEIENVLWHKKNSHIFVGDWPLVEYQLYLKKIPVYLKQYNELMLFQSFNISNISL